MKQNKIVDWFIGVFKGIEIVVTGSVTMIVNIFTNVMLLVTPIAAPIPPAYSIFTAILTRLEAPLYIALASAFAIEVIGMYSSKVTMACYQWEQTKNKTDESIPLKVSLVMTGLFFVVAFVLAISIEIWEGAKIMIFPGFVIIAVSVYVNMAIGNKLKTLTDEKERIAQERSERNNINKEIKLAQKQLDKLQGQLKERSNRLRNFKNDLDTKTKTYIADLETRLKELNESTVLLEAVQIVEHSFNGNTQLQDVVKEETIKLTGLDEKIARTIHSDRRNASIKRISESLNIDPGEVKTLLAKYKGKRFMEFKGEMFAVEKEKESDK